MKKAKKEKYDADVELCFFPGLLIGYLFGERTGGRGGYYAGGGLGPGYGVGGGLGPGYGVGGGLGSVNTPMQPRMMRNGYPATNGTTTRIYY